MSSDEEDNASRNPRLEEDDDDNDEQEEEEFHEAQSEPFALNPAQATGSDTLEFKKKSHRAHYNAAVASVHPDSQARYDLSRDKLNDFLSKIRRRGDDFCLSTLEVPIDLANPLGDTVNLASTHGQVSQQHLKNFANTFIGNKSRASQDDHILSKLLMDSCQEDAQTDLADLEEECTVRGTTCGVLLLETIKKEAAVEVATDPDIIRRELANAHLKFKELNSDVLRLNKWVKRKNKQL